MGRGQGQVMFLNFRAQSYFWNGRNWELQISCAYWYWQSLVPRWQITYLRGCVQGHVTYIFLGITDNISKTVQDRDICNGRLTGNCMRPIEWQQYQWPEMTYWTIGQLRWPWVTSKVTRLLQVFSHGIFVQLCSSWQDFSWQHVARSFCDSWASCTRCASNATPR